MTSTLRVLMAGGGSAGHTSPLIATADALRRQSPDCRITALGTARGLETRVIPAAGLPLELVPAVPLPRRLGADLFAAPRRVWSALQATLEVIDRVEPDVVVGFGGYVSVPAYLAARRRRIPIVVHEGNAVPGLANKLGARLTRWVATSFPGTPLRNGLYIGLPVRSLISGLDRSAYRAEARDFFSLREGLPTLLVTGGSQGARRLNDSMIGAAASLTTAGIQVLHVVGPNGQVVTGIGSEAVPYRMETYVDRMDLAYSAVDAVLCRAGSNTVTEVSGLGLPAVYVPLPIGNGEQAHNAAPVVAAGGGMLVADDELTPTWVAEQIPRLLGDPARLQAMSLAAQGVVPLDADEKLAEMIREAAGGKG
ncbi:MAG TPA: undecaprenyldiphospho-muramoylpentapeptide beta-N-acetylglucosaminyltransferase [Marmoricola sp.]|nr:undecaprenyldiphospho-muramoylpentapeptide beta-N-acetylglucosaminyltransferase [Marmoricola sp.]HNI69858.1 undecaprenyldiphospho-muramoylpentapeptide beta-N-acetylglucosaminyltransferase [Marmoricola sp.]